MSKVLFQEKIKNYSQDVYSIFKLKIDTNKKKLKQNKLYTPNNN